MFSLNYFSFILVIDLLFYVVILFVMFYKFYFVFFMIICYIIYIDGVIFGCIISGVFVYVENR